MKFALPYSNFVSSSSSFFVVLFDVYDWKLRDSVVIKTRSSSKVTEESVENNIANWNLSVNNFPAQLIHRLTQPNDDDLFSMCGYIFPGLFA